MDIEPVLLGGALGLLGGVLSGGILTYWAPIIKHKGEKLLKTKIALDEMLNESLKDLERASLKNFVGIFSALENIEYKLTPYFSKNETGELSKIKSDITDIQEKYEKEQFEVMRDIEPIPGNNKVSRAYMDFLRKVISRLKKETSKYL